MNYYQILQISQTATQLQIKQAYRRLAKQFHPDTQTANSNHEQIILINAAYEVLSDSKKRCNYDQELLGKSEQFLHRRQEKSKAAQEYYREYCQPQKKTDLDEFRWIKDVYLPINRFLTLILNPLERELDALSADPFDDRLMLVFENYLQNCCHYFEQSRQILMSKPNPRQYADLAANIYYCLNTISDGIEDLQRFTQCYDDYYLHTGKELFRRAEQLKIETQYTAKKII